MHPYALIPFAALMVSAAFCAVSIAWNSNRRATRSMGAIFLCTGAWALLDLLTHLETTPEGAMTWFRWIHLPPLLLGPSVLWVFGQTIPDSRVKFDRHVRVGIV